MTPTSATPTVRTAPPETTVSYLNLIESARHPERGITFILDSAEGRPVRDHASWDEMFNDASRYANHLTSLGVGPGSHVAMLAPTTRPLVTAIEACWIMGATVMLLPLPIRAGSVDEFIATSRRRMAAADADLLLIDPQFAPFLTPVPSDPPTVDFAELAAKAALEATAIWEPTSFDDSLDAIIQFTSGSTTEPKGVRVSFDVLLSNSNDIDAHLGLDPERDVCVSWLPLYHDMGLVGILASTMTRSLPLVLGAPQDFMAHPGSWFEWLSEFGGTITAGPNFAYAMAARALESSEETLDLSRVRVAINGAEPVHPDTMRSLVAAGERHGLNAGCVFPAFGMAECGIAGFFPPVGRGLTTEWVDGATVNTGQEVRACNPDDPGAVEHVHLGATVPGVAAKVVHPETGADLPARHVGELWLSGLGVSAGYWNNDEANGDRFVDGWLRTGDLAYLTEDGEGVICGRIKDLIIIAGRNIYPHDIELAATIEGVRKGNVIAFGVERGDTEAVVVVAETRSPSRELGRAVRKAVAAAAEVTPHEVVLVDPGTLPKTSSGKLQRAEAKARYLAGTYTG